MILPKKESSRELFISLFIKAMQADEIFLPASLFDENSKKCDDLSVAEALSLLRTYCVVYRTGPYAGKWSVSSLTRQKYQSGYYEKYGIKSE